MKETQSGSWLLAKAWMTFVIFLQIEIFQSMQDMLRYQVEIAAGRGIRRVHRFRGNVFIQVIQ